jgi:signal peptidase II
MTRGAGLLMAFAVLLLDQALKAWALGGLPRDSLVPLLGAPESGLSAMLVLNPGIVFGTVLPIGDAPNLLVQVLVALVAVTLLVRIARSRRLVLNLGRGAVVGGAVSNLLDRLRHGAVVDYLVIRRGDGGFAFNLADLAVVSGILLMLGWVVAYILTTPRPA